jgi:hypothetical protein
MLRLLEGLVNPHWAADGGEKAIRRCQLRGGLRIPAMWLSREDSTSERRGYRP